MRPGALPALARLLLPVPTSETAASAAPLPRKGSWLPARVLGEARDGALRLAVGGRTLTARAPNGLPASLPPRAWLEVLAEGPPALVALRPREAAAAAVARRLAHLPPSAGADGARSDAPVPAPLAGWAAPLPLPGFWRVTRGDGRERGVLEARGEKAGFSIRGRIELAGGACAWFHLAGGPSGAWRVAIEFSHPAARGVAGALWPPFVARMQARFAPAELALR